MKHRDRTAGAAASRAGRPARWKAATRIGLGVAASGALVATAALSAAAPAGASTRIAHATKYTFTTLDNANDPTFNQLLGINKHGVIAGYFGSGATGHPNQGYVLRSPYGQASYTNENFPGSAQTQVTGINNNGVAVGFYNDAKGHSHAYEVNQATGVFTAIHIPGAVSAAATGINNGGDITGFATDPAGSMTSWLLHSGHLTTFQFPGGSNTTAFGVNSHDAVVGSYLDGNGVMHGFVLSSPLGPVSHWQRIDDPNGIGSTVVNGINGAGDLVGFYTDGAGNTDGMLATP